MTRSSCGKSLNSRVELRSTDVRAMTYLARASWATGVAHVFVNGVPVIENGEHTGATPGRFVRGPGWTPNGD